MPSPKKKFGAAFAPPTDDSESMPGSVPHDGPEAVEEDELTRLLERWSDGDEEARDALIHRLLPVLRKLAARQLSRERAHHTLQPTALVNEAFSRLLERRSLSFKCRGHFVAFTAELMRHVLVDHARAHKAKKRGEGQELLPLDEALGFAPEKSDELIQLDQALDDLARFNPEGARVVALRYFVGLSHQEIADTLDISRIKARRLWTEAKAWLFIQMKPESPNQE